MRLIKPTLFTLPLLVAIAGCSSTPLPALPRPGVPFVHKIDIQQGNVVTQEMVAQLRLGMNKKKVRFVMGTPIIQDTFHAARWDYIYTYHEGGGDTERRLITVVFNEDGKLINVEGDTKAAIGRLEVDKHRDRSVQVPGDYEKGIFGKLKDAMPFTGDDEEDEQKVAEADDAEKQETDEQADEAETDLIYEAGDEEVAVPDSAPPQKKKSFVERLVNAVGLGAEDDDDEEESEYDPGDPKYRDVSDPDVNPQSGPQ